MTPSSSRVRLAVLTEMDAWSASTRYRALQHVPRLRERFACVEVSLPGDTVERAPGRAGQARYFGAHAVNYARRAVAVRRLLARQDALLIQRGLYALGPAAIVEVLRGFSGRVVLDLDDAVFHPRPGFADKGPGARWLYAPRQARKLLGRADAIVVSTPTLARLLPRGAPEPTILPTVPDPAAYRPVVHRPQGTVTVGWAGTVGGLCYLDPLAAVFERLRTERVAEFQVVSSAPWRGPATFRRWRLAEEHDLFEAFSIGIMPLPDTDYTRAKAGFKLLQYMAAGLPIVASPVGVNRELIERSQAGLLAETPQEWSDAITALATDHQLRARLGARGRAFVEGYADLAHQADVLTGLLAP